MARDFKGAGAPLRGDNVTSLAEARRRATEKAAADQRPARGTASLRDWVIGSLFLLMSLAMLWHWLAPLLGGTGLTR
jgi:hypothetical protein